MQMNISGSFSWPIRMLPAQKRPALRAFYGLCRLLDDIADHPSLSSEQKLLTLDGWEHQIDQLAQGTPSDRFTLALLPSISRGVVEVQCLQHIIEGMRMDVRGQMLAPSFATLDDYCFRVAGCVGIVVIRLMGDLSDEARRYAVHLGHALQRTNMLRDIVEDAALGRIYLPREMLHAHHLADMTPQQVPHKMTELYPVMAHLAAQADEHYEQAEALAMVHPMPPAARMMGDVYARLHQRMREDQWSHHTPYRLRFKDRLWLMGRMLHYQAA